MDTITILRSEDPQFDQKFDVFLKRQVETASDIEKRVKNILQDVKKRGDRALCDYTRQYDHVSLTGETLRVSEDEVEEAYTSVDPEVIKDLKGAADRIESYHQKQLVNLSQGNIENERLKEVIRPLQKVGIYVPGGKAAYPSSVLMNALPARVAGVKEIAMVSPRVSNQVLAAAKIAGVNCIYRVGGAQAVGALAYGTESINRVDKIVGPGNIYVETAKRLLFGVVGLDMVAGPSEVLIVADDSAVPSFAASDFIAQAEHDEDAFPLLITTSESFLRQVEQEIQLQATNALRKNIIQKSITNNGLLILTKTLDKAVALANRVAPEHLVLMVSNGHELLNSITNAGAIFLGNYSPVAVGDYMAGPSHVLPTAGTSRFFSPLGVYDFLKRMSVIIFSKDELKKLQPAVARLARLEGLDAHAKAIELRLTSDD
jgi:histidinol dehydrogenase